MNFYPINGEFLFYMSSSIYPFLILVLRYLVSTKALLALLIRMYTVMLSDVFSKSLVVGGELAFSTTLTF